MISDLTQNTNESAETFTFTPMSETQMASTKGGSDIPPWLQQLIDTFGDLLDAILPQVDVEEQLEQDFWDSHGDYIQSLGIDPLEP